MHRGSTLRGWNHAWENTGVRVGEREERGKEKKDLDSHFGWVYWNIFWYLEEEKIIEQYSVREPEKIV